MFKPFHYVEPKTLEEAIQVLSELGTKAKVLAGGTDLLVMMKRKVIYPEYIVCIKNIRELNYIKFDEESGFKIGALSTHSEIADSSIIRSKFDLLATACKKVGTPQIRNMGTIGGNICQAGPSQDTIPSLLALNAKLKLVGSGGERVIPIDRFFIAPFETVLEGKELLTEIQIPTPPLQSGGCYKWITKKSMVDETLVGVAVYIVADSFAEICGEIRIGLSSVAPTPFRARKAEEYLRGKKIDLLLLEQVAKVVSEETKPRSLADYRRKMTGVLLKRAVEESWEKIHRTVR